MSAGWPALIKLRGTLLGPGTKKICERAWRLFGKAAPVQAQEVPALYPPAAPVEKTHPVQRAIGERRNANSEGQPGFLRVDTVPQGDLDGVKGLLMQWPTPSVTMRLPDTNSSRPSRNRTSESHEMPPQDLLPPTPSRLISG
jgi:hypothetical protein